MFLQMLFVHHYYTDTFCLFHNKLVGSTQRLRPSNDRHFTTIFTLGSVYNKRFRKRNFFDISVSHCESYVELTKKLMVFIECLPPCQGRSASPMALWIGRPLWTE